MSTSIPLTQPERWFRDFGRPPRIMGLDVARGLAIIGMIGAHLGATRDYAFDLGHPETWVDLVNGRSSILFAVLAGISLTLMTGRSRIPAPEQMPDLRLRLFTRGAVIFALGILLELLNTPIAVILTVWGALYMVSIPFLRWRPSQLLTLAGILALVAPPFLAIAPDLLLYPSGGGVNLLLFGYYPVPVWLVFLLGGMAIGRADLERIVWRILGVGTALSVIGYATGAVVHAPVVAMTQPGGVGWDGWLDAVTGTDFGGLALAALLDTSPHSGGTAEILGSGGLAVAVIALCILISRPLRVLLLPLASLGSMPLTGYVAQLLALWLIAGPGAGSEDNLTWLSVGVTVLAGATAWAAFIGRGPLETVVAKITDAAVSTRGNDNYLK